MGLSRKLLGADEVEVLHLRTHGKALIVPSIVFLLCAVALGVGLAMMPDDAQPWGSIALAVLVTLAFIAWSLVPFLRWRTTTYTITDRRVISRKGILNRSGHDLPLVRVNDVSYHRSLLDRMLGCGTLVLQTAAEAPVELPDIPDVESVHVTMTELLFHGPQAALAPREDT